MKARTLALAVVVSQLAAVGTARADGIEFLKARATVYSDLQLRSAAAASVSKPLADRPGISASMLQAWRHVDRMWISFTELPDDSGAEITENVHMVLSINVPGCTEADSWGLINALPVLLTRKSTVKDYSDRSKSKYKLPSGIVDTIAGACPAAARQAVVNAFGPPAEQLWDNWGWTVIGLAQSDFERAPDHATADTFLTPTRELRDQLLAKEGELGRRIEDLEQQVRDLRAGNNCAGGDPNDPCQIDEAAIAKAEAEIAKLRAELADVVVKRSEMDKVVSDLEAEVAANAGATWERIAKWTCALPGLAVSKLKLDAIGIFATVGTGGPICLALRANILAVYPGAVTMREFTTAFWVTVAATAGAGYAARAQVLATCAAEPISATKCFADETRLAFAVAAVYTAWVVGMIDAASALVVRLFADLLSYLPSLDDDGGGGAGGSSDGSTPDGAAGGGAGGGEGP